MGRCHHPDGRQHCGRARLPGSGGVLLLRCFWHTWLRVFGTLGAGLCSARCRKSDALQQVPGTAELECFYLRNATLRVGDPDRGIAAAVQAQAMVDDAISDAPQDMALCIVHGTGTGRLRASLHDLLKRHPQVSWVRILTCIGTFWSSTERRNRETSFCALCALCLRELCYSQSLV